MVELKKKKIMFKGKNVYYKTLPSLAKKLKISKQEAKQLVEDINSGNTNKYIEKDGNIGRYNISTDKPLFLKDFGVKRLTNKQLLNNQGVKGIEIADNINPYAVIGLMITAKFQFDISNDTNEIRSFTWDDDLSSSQITNEYVSEFLRLNYFTFGEVKNLKVIDYKISSVFTEQKFNMKGMELYNGTQHLKLDNLFNEVITNDKWKDCVFDFLCSQYPKLSKKKMKGLRTIEDLNNWSIDNNLKMLCYDINGNIVSSHYPEKKNKMKNLVFIAFNNHLYPLKNSCLHKFKKPEKYNIKTILEGSGMEMLVKFLHKGVLPEGIYFSDDRVLCFNVGEDKYVDNVDYEVCGKILKQFGLEDKLSPLTNLMNISSIFEGVYVKENIKSFLPQNKKFIKGGFNYNNKDLSGKIDLNNGLLEEIETIDKNKAYSYSLQSLEYLLCCDIKCSKINLKLEEDHKIIKHFLYIVKPQQSSILLPDTNLYTGEHLLFCKKEGVKFKALEEISCEKKDNYYSTMIRDLFDKLEPKHFKKIVNVMIGKMERNNEIQIAQKVKKICNEDETDRSEGFIKRIKGTKYNMVIEKKDRFNLYNQKPIAVQIKDKARIEIYKMLCNLGVKSENILQVKTDSISFIPKNKGFMKYINKSLEGWKIEKYTPITDPEVFDRDFTFKYINKDTKNILGNCYAGAGKTHTILNEIIPAIEKDNNKKLGIVNDYIILTPSHSTLKEYRLKKYTCNVIQRYSLNGDIPDEKHIIIDEIGMVDNQGWNVIYKLFLKGRKIYAYGDFKQLKAVDGKVYDNEIFLNYIFNQQDDIKTNYRNNFTKKYYDDLMNCKKQDHLISEMKKYREKKYYDAQTIICYRNKTKDKYNDLMCKRLKIKSMKQKGTKIISITNDLKKNGIYNKFLYEVSGKGIGVDGNPCIEITDGVETHNINEDQFEKCFNYSYARTLYSVQGETLKSLYYPDEDLYFLDGRTTYTLISRLKEELGNKQKTENDKYKKIPPPDRSCKKCKVACCCRCENPSLEFCEISKRNWCNSCRGWKCC